MREAFCSAVPARRCTLRRNSPRLEPSNKTIDQGPVEDLDAPPTQRHTVSASIEAFRHTFTPRSP
ncbi:hypothetical protein [Streptomyces sp. NPDC006285]|uniref:hypothetical protein n=1 Tax=Streptomyces sp. NPDC006285 TaxID=3364742 RepID=UPI003674563C